MAATPMASRSAYRVTRTRKQHAAGLTTSSKNTVGFESFHSTEVTDIYAAS